MSYTFERRNLGIRRRSRPSAYASSNVRRPTGSCSARSAWTVPVGRPRSSNARCPRAGGATASATGACPGRGGTGANRRRWVPAADRCARSWCRRPGGPHAPRRRPRCDAERERRRVDRDRCHEARGAAARSWRVDAPTGLTHEETVDGQPVAVGVERQASEVDGDPRGAVAQHAEPVGPRCEQRESAGVPTAERLEPTREREVLTAAVPQGDAGHPDAGEEGGGELARTELDPGFAPEPPLRDRCAQRAGHTSSRFSTRRSPGAYRSSRPGFSP